MDRFKNFTDEELYVLKRQAIESSAEITLSERYSDEQIAIHSNLLNEVVETIKKRGTR